METEITIDKLLASEPEFNFSYDNPRAGKCKTDYVEIYVLHKDVERLRRNIHSTDETIKLLVHLKSGTRNVHDIIFSVYDDEAGIDDIINVDLTDEERNTIVECAFKEITKQRNTTKQIGETIHTVGELKEFLNQLNDNDQVVIETIDMETGDAQDLYMFHMDVIDNVQLIDGSVISEVRFCQEKNY